MTKTLHDDIETVLLDEQTIAKKVLELGKRVSDDYRGKALVLVCILKGAVVFFSDLVRTIEIPVDMDFMAISSYGNSRESSGVVQIVKDMDINIEGKHVLVIEDIMDSGLTLQFLRDLLLARSPASLKLCCLLDKAERRQCDITPDYRGFLIPDKFVVGYGLDYAHRYRNLRYVGVLKPEIYRD